MLDLVVESYASVLMAGSIQNFRSPKPSAPKDKKKLAGPFKLPAAIQDTNYHQIQPFLPSPLLLWNGQSVQSYSNQLLKQLFWGVLFHRFKHNCTYTKIHKKLVCMFMLC